MRGDTAWALLGGARSTSIAPLAPGRFTFEARAIRPGQPPGPALRQEFVATLPFYRRGWSLAIGVFLLLLPAGLVYHVRTSRRLAIERLRARIASDLHDDLGSALTQVSLYCELIRRASEPELAR